MSLRGDRSISEALNLDYTPVADHDYGLGLTFRDP